MRGTIQLQYMIYEIYKFQTGWVYAGHLDSFGTRDFKYVIGTVLQESGRVVTLNLAGKCTRTDLSFSWNGSVHVGEWF